MNMTRVKNIRNEDLNRTQNTCHVDRRAEGYAQSDLAEYLDTIPEPKRTLHCLSLTHFLQTSPHVYFTLHYLV
jgi:hypothetical protein